MKVLLIAPRSDFTLSIKNSFEKNGAEVCYLNERKNYFVPSFWSESPTMWSWTVRKSKWLKTLNKKKFNRKIIEICEKFEPDILLTTKGTTISKQTTDWTRKKRIKSVNWWIENPYHDLYKKWVLENYTNFDFFLSFDKSALNTLPPTNITKVVYLPFGIDTDLYLKTIPNSEEVNKYSCDVCFVGALYPEREELLIAVKNLGVDLKIFGWRDWIRSSLKDCYCGPLNTIEMAKLFKCAKISINSNLKPTMGSLNFRTFEILAAGGFELCDNQSDLPDNFSVGSEIEVYSSTEELCDKIKFYLNNPEKRSEIAKNGQARVLKDHTMDKRIRQIPNLIK